MSAFKRFRDAISGRYVPPEAAASHPHTTIGEQMQNADWTAREAQRLMDDMSDWLGQRLDSEPRLSQAKRDAIVEEFRGYVSQRLGLVSHN